MIAAEPLRADDEARYDAFLATRPDALFYHSLAYRDLLLELLGCRSHYLVARDGDAIVGVLPLLYADADGGRVWNSLPYYGSNGDVVAASADAERALVEAYSQLVTADGTLAATVVANPFRAHPTAGYPATLADRRLAHVTSLDGHLWDRVEPSARRNVRKAESLGIEVDRDADALLRLHELHEQNIRAIGGLPKDRRFFELVRDRLEPGRHFDLWVGRLRSEVVAGLLVFYFGSTVEYFTPAIDHEHRSEQPLALVLAQALEHAAARGFSRWNWGGTWLTQTTLRRFKRKWGAEERPYEYRVHVNDPALLAWSRDDLAKRFPGFYLVPYSALAA